MPAPSFTSTKNDHSDKSPALMYILLAVLLSLGVLGGRVFFLSTQTATNAQPSSANVSIVPTTIFNQKDVLKIQTFVINTPTPLPVQVPTLADTPVPSSSSPGTGGGTCPSVDGPRDNCTCLEPMSNPIVVCPNLSQSECTAQGGDFPTTAMWFSLGKCTFPGDEKDGTPGCDGFCEAKPVVYLYPTKDIFVNVAVKTQGHIVISNPTYPDGGWKQVLAHPNGQLIYQAKRYSELFYETSVNYVAEPQSGIVIPMNNLRERLSEITYQLGLTTPEQDEFLDFWVPKLQNLNKPYLYFSILDTSEKERTDHLDISPRPDTFISFMAYFKPLASEFSGMPALLLPKRPVRKGFTAVEWGGTIAPESSLIQ